MLFAHQVKSLLMAAVSDHLHKLNRVAALELADGTLLNRQGHVSAAADLLASTLDEIPEGSFRFHHTRFLGELAHALGRAGETSKGLEAIGKAIKICDRRGERWFFSELLRVEGEIVLMEGGPNAASEAEDRFRQSIDWARRQGALSWELRSATSLAQLRSGQARNQEARELLGPIYDGFTEGFETSDLKAAKGLLDGLS